MLAEAIVRNENASAQVISEDQAKTAYDGSLSTIGPEETSQVTPNASLVIREGCKGSREIRSSERTLNGPVGCASTGRMMPDIGI
jgi:hypothetical protein